MKKMRTYLAVTTLVFLLSCHEDKVEADCKGSGTGGYCTDHYAPVCGCDGVTYGNACGATAAGVKRYTPGEC